MHLRERSAVLVCHEGRSLAAIYLTAQIPVLAPGEKREPTFYNRHGDWFGWGCVVITAVMILDRLRQMFQRKP